MSITIEALKQVNLVDFLREHYSLECQRVGSGYVTRSPFAADRQPSLTVREYEGRWLFKDFSSGLGGSIIDLVGALEGLSDAGQAIRRVRELVGETVPASPSPSVVRGETTGRSYDIAELYQRFRGQDATVCRRYLLERGIGAGLVEQLIEAGEVVHNRYQERSYCCFAVRDGAGELRCLDNHEIDGGGKFVLGAKHVYSRDWPQLAQAEEAFVCEGIIDYLSIKTMDVTGAVGIALLGNQLLFEPGLLAGCRRLITALDNDRGGISAVVDLTERYPETELVPYPLDGHKDANELLQARGKKGRRLSVADKLDIYRAFQSSGNKSELARQWGIDRSYLYQLVGELEESLAGLLSSRQAGRPPADRPATVQEAWQQLQALQEQIRQMGMERDQAVCRSEFLGLRLKWAEIEAAELRGEKIGEDGVPARKPQVKKKKRKRR
jgi:DNA primase